MTGRDVGRVLATGRILLGGTLVTAPGVVRLWAGGAGAAPGVHLVTRAAGIRDLLLGWRTLQALDGSKPVATLFRDGAVADAVDLAACLLAYDRLPRLPRLAIVAAASAATAVGWHLSRALDRQP